ncbi:cadherin-like beta sandwich domain-containing protein [uncultured Robinsoniella sp.]|uniref:cadherin-like beta sandwich domain-containing protein n=1 Tax=uncultured Robinsoniella sp. TaxID=904190 RepID=UPI00374E79FB
MKILKGTWKYQVVLAMLMLWLSSMTVFATSSSSDNSLATLGIENAEVSPEFYYSTTEYEVKVPAGTKSLTLDPQPSDVNAEIASVDGNQLDNGNGTVTITVAAEDGSKAVYTLHVTADAVATTEAASEAATNQAAASESQPATEKTAAQTESVQNDTVKMLNTQVEQVNQKLELAMKILYGMIAFAVILLFIIINLALKNKDLKDDLREAENTLDFNTNEFARKEKTLSSDYYYAPVQEMQPESADAPGVPLEKVQETTEEVFGNGQAQVKADVLSRKAEDKPVNNQAVKTVKKVKKVSSQQNGITAGGNAQKPVNSQRSAQGQQKQLAGDGSQGQKRVQGKKAPQGRPQGQPKQPGQPKQSEQTRPQNQARPQGQPKAQGQPKPQGQSKPQGQGNTPDQVKQVQPKVQKQSRPNGQPKPQGNAQQNPGGAQQPVKKQRPPKKVQAESPNSQVNLQQGADENPPEVDVTMIDL